MTNLTLAAGALTLLLLATAAWPQATPQSIGSDVSHAGVETPAGEAPAGGAAAPARSGCGTSCEFSSSGSADLHAFDHGPDAVVHVLFVEAQWTRPKLQRLRRRAESWQHTVEVQLPGEASPVVLDHWSSDLPAARVELVAVDRASVTFAITTRALQRLRAGRLYRTQILVSAPQDLDGAIWEYREEVESAGRGRPSGAARASAPRKGRVGWCPTCYAVWGSTDQPGAR